MPTRLDHVACDQALLTCDRCIPYHFIVPRGLPARQRPWFSCGKSTNIIIIATAPTSLQQDSDTSWKMLETWNFATDPGKIAFHILNPGIFWTVSDQSSERFGLNCASYFGTDGKITSLVLSESDVNIFCSQAQRIAEKYSCGHLSTGINATHRFGRTFLFYDLWG